MPPKGLKTVTYKTPGIARRAVFCLLAGAALAAASLYVQARLGLPLPFSLSSRSAGKPPSASAGRKSQELALSPHSLYALQLGAFTQEGAARQLAQEFSARGAAGYVHFDGAYRVLAAAYSTRAEAQTVQTHLGAQGISTYIHPCSQAGLTLRAAGTADQVEALQEALSYLDGLGDKLLALSGGLDGGDMPAETACAALQSEGATCTALRSRLAAAFPEGLPGSLRPLDETLARAAETAERAKNESSAARIGAALKHCHLTVFFGLSAFAEGL